MANSVETLYKATMGLVTIDTPNSALDGAGSITTIVTGQGSGTFVKSLIMKGQGSCGSGMLRLFTKKSGGSAMLNSEYTVRPIDAGSGNVQTFSRNIRIGLTLETDEELCVSTENGDTFNIIAECFEISYSTTAGCICSSLEYVANNGSTRITTGNPNRDGSGTLVTVLTAGAASSYTGCAISSILIKAQQTTSQGMVRLFIQDNVGSDPVLFSEITVPAMVQGSTTSTYMFQVIGAGTLCIPAEYSILASTEISETFSVITQAADWKNV